jgi:hypothetical protein
MFETDLRAALVHRGDYERVQDVPREAIDALLVQRRHVRCVLCLLFDAPTGARRFADDNTTISQQRWRSLQSTRIS